MIPYNDILVILSDKEFIKKCCELSRDFQDQDDIDMMAYIGKKFKGLVRIELLWKFESMLYQARIGWNKKNLSSLRNEITLYKDKVFREFKNTLYFYAYAEFEPNKPLSEEIQALIIALNECFKME